MNLLQLRQAALFNVLYFCMARFEEVQALRTENVKISPQGNLELQFQKGKTNQFLDRRSCFIAPSLEAGNMCPVRVIIHYCNAFILAGGSSFLFPSFTGARNIIPGSQLSYNNALSMFLKLLKSIGFSNEEVAEYGLHSCRIGNLQPRPGM